MAFSSQKSFFFNMLKFIGDQIIIVNETGKPSCSGELWVRTGPTSSVLEGEGPANRTKQ